MDKEDLKTQLDIDGVSEYIATNTSFEDLLCQIAEEAAELSQAALKLRRAMKGATPVPQDEARKHLDEEMADTVVSGMIFLLKEDLDETNTTDHFDILEKIVVEKTNRWYKRMTEGFETSESNENNAQL